jgi:hypothetical protein
MGSTGDATTSSAGSRPVGGAPGGMPRPNGLTPPASVPLTFFAAGGAGLVAMGLAIWFAADRAVIDPRHGGVLSAVHVAVLAFLSTVVLGALHQFAPVVGRRGIRSPNVARLSAVCIVGAGWLLSTGFAHGPEDLVAIGGTLGVLAAVLAAWNLSAPVGPNASGVPVWGIRLALAYLLVTVSFGIVYALNRQTGWFTPTVPARLLSHAHLGLLGWLGLTYVAVAEKLWPMFLLSHRPSQRSGAVAVGALAAGTLPLALGLLFGVAPLALAGAAVVAVGLLAHLTSLVGAVRHRRRPLELLHAFLFASAGFLVLALVAALVASVPAVSPAWRVRLVATEVAALISWLTLAVVGHSHKIVPFIGYSVLRTRGIRRKADGSPLLFADLYDRRVAIVGLALLAPGLLAVLGGLSTGTSAAVAVGGALVFLGALALVVNLAAGPLRALRLPPTPAPARRRPDAPRPTAVTR